MAGLIRLPRGQAPSLKGAVQEDSVRGVLRLRAWPSKRGKAARKKAEPQEEWFRQAQWLTKYITPEQAGIARDSTAGTPLMPRDILTMAIAGRLFRLQIDDGTWINPMSFVKDVSDALDVLSKSPGTMLFRDTDRWKMLALGSAGQYLKSDGARPIWGAGGGGGGGVETCSAYLTADKALAGNPVTVPWEDASPNSGPMWINTAPTRLTAPSAGSINIEAIIWFGAGINTTAFGIIVKNGSVDVAATNQDVTNGRNIQTGWINVDEGDYFELQFTQMTGTRTMTANNSRLSATFVSA